MEKLLIELFQEMIILFGHHLHMIWHRQIYFFWSYMKWKKNYYRQSNRELKGNISDVIGETKIHMQEVFFCHIYNICHNEYFNNQSKNFVPTRCFSSAYHELEQKWHIIPKLYLSIPVFFFIVFPLGNS